MNNLDYQYSNILKDILKYGQETNDRTGVGTISMSGTMIRHNMSDGFPIITLKKVAFKTLSIELEGFLKGITDKNWYKDRKCNIWNQWSNKTNKPDNKTQEEWNDLGPIYGYQWNNFNGTYNSYDDYSKNGYNQLDDILHSLENHSTSRRMLVSAWNPQQAHKQALPPCHFAWQVITRDKYLDLIFYMRSSDFFLGVPFNISSYGLLLSLLAKQFNYIPGTLVGFMGDSHIYKNHLNQVESLFDKKSYDLPTLIIDDEFKDVRSFDYNQASLKDYKHNGVVKGSVAV